MFYVLDSMSGTPDFDIEAFRTKHESSHEWALRSAFIREHHDKFPRNRLLCLANCFVSVECYGCRYSADVMRQLDELGTVIKTGIGKNRSLIGQPPGVKFVKSSNDATKHDISTKARYIFSLM